MVIEITVDSRIVKRHYLYEVKDFWIDLELMAYGNGTSQILKEIILEMLSDGRNEVKTEIEEISYAVKIIRNGNENGLNPGKNNENKLPEDIEAQLREKVLRNFITYNRGLI